MEIKRHHSIERAGNMVRYNFIVYGHVAVYLDIDIETGEYLGGTFKTTTKQHEILWEYVTAEYEYITELKRLIALEDSAENK